MPTPFDNCAVNPYAVVVTDPDTSIREDLALVDEIRRLRPSVRVILLAPSGTPEDLIETLRERVFLCQCAPFNEKEIARYVVSAIEADNSAAGIEVLSADRSWISVRMNCDLLNADRLTAFFKQFQMTLPEHPPEEMMIAFEEILNNAIDMALRMTLQRYWKWRPCGRRAHSFSISRIREGVSSG